MVNFIEKTIYLCPYCDYQDDDEDDVYEHRKEHIDKIIEKQSDVFECNICKEEFKRNKEAEIHEQKHITNNDKINNYGMKLIMEVKK